MVCNHCQPVGSCYAIVVNYHQDTHFMTKGKKTKIVIEGVTQEGKIFRPSDWAERLSGQLSTFKNQRVQYSPLLKPSHKEGKRCLVVDCDLKTVNPALYQQILDFAKAHKLTMREEEDGDKHANPP